MGDLSALGAKGVVYFNSGALLISAFYFCISTKCCGVG
jgi:hypothetical protein